MSWLIIALIAGFLFGITNFFDRFLVEKRIRDPFLMSIIGGMLAPLVGVVLFIIRGFPIFSLREMSVLALGGFCSVIALVPWYKAIKIDDTSRVVPYFQFIPVVVLVMSYVMLGERLTANQLIGFTLIIVGGLSLAIEKSSKELFRVRKSFWYIMLSILLWAPVAVLFKIIAIERNFWDAIIYEALGVGIGAITLWLYAKTNVWKGITMMAVGTWGVVSINEVAYIGARALNFYAILIGPTALVSVVGGIQPLFALIIGLAMSKWFPNIIREDIKPKTIKYKLAAITVMFIGIVFIYR